MCGITGLFNFSGEKKDIFHPLMAMAQSMHHRGPDDEGYLLYNTTNRQLHALGGNTTSPETYHEDLAFKPSQNIHQIDPIDADIALAHKRLSIIDISPKGHQPQCDDQQRYWIVFNGEIYNYKEIKSDLETKGIQFKTGSDTEVLLKAYIEMGPSILERLNGMFAFIIYDTKQKEIFIARDRLGIKPVYYAEQNGIYLFASEMKTILSSGLIEKSINSEGLWHNLSMGISPRPITAFEGISTLKPGHFMKIDAHGKKEISQYWKIPIHQNEIITDEAVAKKELDELLNDSIRYRLISDVKIGTFLSGGIDSGVVSSMAGKQYQNIDTYTLGFEQDEFNEVEEASSIAQEHGLNHIVEIIDPKNVLTDIEDMMFCFEEPYMSLGPPFLVNKLAANHGTKVVLNGLGGDELFGGYRYYNRINLWKNIRPFKGLIQTLPNQLSSKVKQVKKLLQYKDIAQYYMGHHSVFNEQEKQKLFKGNFDYNTAECIESLYDEVNQIPNQALNQLSYFDLNYYLGSHQLHRNDQFSMFHSIEGRFPFLDHRLVEFAFRVDPNLKVKNGVRKHLLRETARDYLPESCFSMAKKGFSLPINYWIKNELKDLVKEKLNDLKKRDIFNNNYIDQIHQSGTHKQIWHLVNTEIWMNKFID